MNQVIARMFELNIGIMLKLHSVLAVFLLSSLADAHHWYCTTNETPEKLPFTAVTVNLTDSGFSAPMFELYYWQDGKLLDRYGRSSRRSCKGEAIFAPFHERSSGGACLDVVIAADKNFRSGDMRYFYLYLGMSHEWEEDNKRFEFNCDKISETDFIRVLRQLTF